MRLLILQDLRVVDDHNETLGYQYRVSRSAEKGSWLIRWEYLRRRSTPDYAYPPAHVHINARPVPDDLDVALPKLHVPTGRIPLELVLWHLIAEWGVQPKREDWRHILEESIGGRRAP